ncbi:hypothetical protein ABIC10_007823 [Bradyrhizobium sp. S3.2.12]
MKECADAACLRPLAAVHHRADHGIGLHRGLLRRYGRILQVQCNSGGQHLDMADFFRRRVEKDVAIFRRSASAPSLKEVLQADPDLSFHAADRLLQLASEDRIRFLDLYGILQSLVEIVHAHLLFFANPQ